MSFSDVSIIQAGAPAPPPPVPDETAPTTKKQVSPVPKVGDPAPLSPGLPLARDRPTLVVFLRHCWCPFAEQALKQLTDLSSKHRARLHCVAVSQGTRAATDRWLPHAGGEWYADIVVEPPARSLYARWGLGTSSTWHAFNPRTIYAAAALGGVPTSSEASGENGSRWQTGGAFAVDAAGVVRWAHVDRSADDVPDLEAEMEKVFGLSEREREAREAGRRLAAGEKHAHHAHAHAHDRDTHTSS